MSLPPPPPDRQDLGALPWVAIVLGVIGVLAGLGLNSAVVLLGAAGVGLGLWAQQAKRRDFAKWGIACGALAILGYMGLIADRVPNS